MNSRDRLLAAIQCGNIDYTPCSFMIFFNLYERCATEREFVEEQLALGLDTPAGPLTAGRIKG
jgi:hypothetical protein